VDEWAYGLKIEGGTWKRLREGKTTRISLVRFGRSFKFVFLGRNLGALFKEYMLFSNTNYPIELLVGQIDAGQLGLPDLQRPFVWKRSKVRDLFDSLYRGYPAGYFLLWNTGADVDNHAIGSDNKPATAPKMIVDGQQRLTSLYAVMKAQPVINEENESQLIRIAFNPLTEEFAVANAATDNDVEYIANISDIWNSETGAFKFTTDFMEKLGAQRELSPDDQRKISGAIDRLAQLPSYQFSALELSSKLEIQTVAEIFQRINSSGVPLNSADFILTLMSVYWPTGRHELENFAKAAKIPSTGTPSPYNHFHAPSPDQLLRVVVGLALKRGVLQAAYQVLRGRNPVTGEVTADNRTARFDDLKEAQAAVLNLTSWHEYLVAVKQAGFRGRRMLTSANNFLYGYLIFLIGRNEFSVPHGELRDVISRWFFMSSITGRYTGSPETILESDLRRIEQAKSAEDFVGVLEAIIDTQLTEDYWRITLPDQLESSAAWSPTLFSYYAALNLLDATALFSSMKITDLLDPDVCGTKSPIERHHLFPKAYLASIGITGKARTNQIGNYAFLEWADNIQISSKPPTEYFPEYFGKLSAAEQERSRFWHALPPNWETMEYAEFLKERRSRIAAVTKAGFERLTHGKSLEDSEGQPPSVAELLKQMETYHVEFKASARVPQNSDIPEKVIQEGVIKTVAAFMNADGGTLGIGISDDGDILGIQPDLELKGHDLDQYQNWLSSLLMHTIGEAATASLVSIRFETVGSEATCLIDVRASPSEVFAKTTKGPQVFYARVGNTTRIFEGPELVRYIKQHWS